MATGSSTQSISTPIPGIPGRDLPTSSDIHLYADVASAKTSIPLLYADCEGLDGGEREPEAATIGRSKDNRDSMSAEDPIEESQFFQEREITWCDSDEKRTREFAVTQLYPRILFAFSDVIVFVHRNAR
jgi:hypothetical protein